MDLNFEIGDSSNPRGHALVYFRGNLDSEKVYATYVVVFPLPVNISKYVPPFLASSLGSTSMADLSSFPMPPIPEEVESYLRLTQLSESRNDDLIYGGIHSETDIPAAMQMINDIAQAYTELWTEYDSDQSPHNTIDPNDEGLGVNEVMYSLLGEKDRLNELSKLVVKFRYALEGGDQELRKEVDGELRTLARFLPLDYQMPKLIDAAQDSSTRGTRLAQLYLERCYGLSDDDGDKVDNLDKEIKLLEALE